MTAKIDIIKHLGEETILIPDLINKALNANDRAKLRMTALQEAVVQAKHPEARPRTFETERRAAGIADSALDNAIVHARKLDAKHFEIPGAGKIISEIYLDIETMLAPLKAAKQTEVEAFERRLSALQTARTLGEKSAEQGDILDEDRLTAIASADRGRADSAHLLVMDLHKALNRFAANMAVETVAGAHVLGLISGDRPRIEAFMHGLDRTRALAFGHPGLDTTASRVAERLVLQNDIGTTDAHVFIVTIEEHRATITYTDVHRKRARFFMGLFAKFPVDWTPLADHHAEGLAEGGQFYLITGTYEAQTEHDLLSFLDAVGSRLVFLIDWNRARKALEIFVDKKTAFKLLQDAANEEYGHRGFLELGGADLIFDAVQLGAKGRIPYGARLDKALGAAQAGDFLARVLRLASEGLKAGRSIRLLRDEVRAELGQSFGSAEKTVLALALRQLGFTRMLASIVEEGIAGLGHLSDGERQHFADRAKRLEHKGDMLIIEAHEMASGPFGHGGQFLPVINAVEDASDAFEEAAF
ncbi:MAG TPA: hypothetical protein VEQ35_03730, partial [Beijerinckia sp.]|nr:hypothetical protein [Beijerinckia sp.]